MRKTLVSLAASLALCGAGTAALIATNARAQISDQPRHPVMLAMATDASGAGTAAPPAEGGMPPGPGMHRPPMAGEFCKDIYAHQAGALAFLQAKLSLAPAQDSLFDRWKTVKLDIAKRREDDCASRIRSFRDNAARGKHSPVDRMAREETRLKQRLADLDAESPALSSLYDSLSGMQKAEFDRGGMMIRHRMMGGPGMMHGMGPHGLGPRGMGPRGMGPGGMPPMGAPADQPPPPPPQ